MRSTAMLRARSAAATDVRLPGRDRHPLVPTDRVIKYGADNVPGESPQEETEERCRPIAGAGHQFASAAQLVGGRHHQDW
ncbi:MAG TPA: hypothetical protein VGH98_24225 [Gemmatimonadaceae bacterium]|jgi:hypothetical protein